METTQPKESEKPPLLLGTRDYEEIYKLYAVWKSLPMVTIKKMTSEQIMRDVGIQDETILSLIDIHTQEQFSERYNVHRDTLTDWNKKIKKKDPLFEAKGWAQALTKNVMMSLYLATISKGDAFLYKLWFQVMNDWSEKAKLVHEMPPVTFNIKLAEKKQDGPIIDNGGKTHTNKLGNDGKASASIPVSDGQRN